MARRLQCSLLPKELPLDIFKIDDEHIGIYMHGVPASMLTVFLRSSINKKTLSPAEALNQLYKEFNRDYYDQELYITIFSYIQMQATTPVPYYSTMKATGSTFLEYPEFPSVTGLTIRNILKKVFQLKKATDCLCIPTVLWNCETTKVCWVKKCLLQ